MQGPHTVYATVDAAILKSLAYQRAAERHWRLPRRRRF
jgi:hypothetical protein